MQLGHYLASCCAQIRSGGYVVISMDGDDGTQWAYSVGLTENFEQPEVVAVGPPGVPESGATPEELVDLVAASTIAGVDLGSAVRRRLLTVDDQVDRFDFGRIVMSVLDRCWPSSVELVEQVVTCRVPSG